MVCVFHEVSVGELLETLGGSIKTGPFGTVLKAAEYTATGVPVVSVGEVGYGRLRVHDRTKRVDETVTGRLEEYVLRAGDVVFGRKGAVDRSAWVRREEDGWFLGSDGIRLRFPESVDARFMAYQFQSSRVRVWLLQHATGTTMASLNEPVLKSVPVFVPPLEEQRGIAATLGALDDKIDSNRRVIELLDELARIEFRRWRQTAALDETSTFGDFVDVYGGATPKTKVEEYWGGDLAWTTPTDVTGLSAPYLFTTSRKITQEGLGSCTAVMHPTGTIFMTSRATIGAFAINQVPAATNQGFIAVRPRQELHRWFLFEEMRSRVDEFIGNANGSTFLEISRGRFKALPVDVPTIEAVERLHAVVDPLHTKAAQCDQENQKLADLRDALLPELLSGRIRVPEAALAVAAASS